MSKQGHTSMQSHVNLETALCREWLVADITWEVLDARVRLQVSGQRALDGERAEALRALVGLFVGVHAHVTYQIGRLLELFGAVRALMPAYAVHLQRQLSHITRYSRKCYANFPRQKQQLNTHNTLTNNAMTKYTTIATFT